MELLVKDALKSYWEEHVAIKAVAKSRIDYAIGPLLKHLSANDLSAIDIRACREYQKKRAAEGVKDSTIRYELGILKAAANHCVKWRYLDARAMPIIEMPAGSPEKRMWLFKDELQRLAAAAEGRCLWFILLAYYTAGRKESIETLERRQIDLEARRINLSKRGAPKTKKRKPIVPIDPLIYDRLVEYLASHNSPWALGTPNDIRYEFDKAAERAGLNVLEEKGMRDGGRLTPHILRHTRATHLLQDGKSPFAVANLLGDNLQTVLRVYGHACPDFLAEAIA